MLTLLPAVLVVAVAEPVAATDDTADASEGTRECVALGAAEGAPLAETVKKECGVREQSSVKIQKSSQTFNILLSNQRDLFMRHSIAKASSKRTNLVE